MNPKWTYIDGYIDEALSGTSVSKRESFLKMIEDAKRGNFDFIVTKEISRFSRNTLDSIRYTQELLVAGVGVLFQSDNINTLMPDSELRLTIMSSIAQDEVRKISERVKFGFKRAIEKGVVLGSNNIWGYIKQDGRLVIDEEEAELVRQIFMMYAIQNMGMRSICQHLKEQGYKNNKGNDFSFSTIKGILTNPKYKGFYCGNKTHKYDYKLNDVKNLDESEWVMYRDEANVPAIVPEEIWDKANDILQKRGQKQSAADKTSYQNKYAYSGKIYCGEHKIPFYRALYRYKSGNKEVWQCRDYSAKGKAACSSPTLYTTEVDEIINDVYGAIKQSGFDVIQELLQIYSDIGGKSRIQEDISKAKMQMHEILKKKDKLLDLNIKGHLSDDEFAMRNGQLNLKIVDLEMLLTTLDQEKNMNNENLHTTESLHAMIVREADFTEGFSSSVIDILLNRIEVHKTGDRNVINLMVHFKICNDVRNYQVTRRRGTSVCSEVYI